MAALIGPTMLATAARQPNPPNRLPPSRSSWASAFPVEAPEGIEMETRTPGSTAMVAATVGRPRLSNTSQASNCSIRIIDLSSPQNC